MEWKLGRSGALCLECKKRFENGDTYYSTIDLDQDEPKREDYCPGCFRTRTSEGMDHDALGSQVVFWKAKKSDEVERKKVVDFDRLREIFVKMVAHAGARHRELAYLIGLLLIRKRLLKLKEFATVKGVDMLILTQPKTDKVFRVEAPLLSSAQITSLREKLSALVDGELDWGEDDAPTQDHASDDNASDDNASDDDEGAESTSPQDEDLMGQGLQSADSAADGESSESVSSPAEPMSDDPSQKS